MFADALHVAQIVKKNYGEFYLLGFSLGSSLASYVASKMKVQGVFLIAAFDSIALVSKNRFGFSLPKWLVRYKFPTIEFVKNIDAPTYLYVSKDDEIAYIQNGKNLSKNIKNLGYYKEYNNLSHKELLWDEEVINHIRSVFS